MSDDIALDVINEIAEARKSNYASTHNFTEKRDHIGISGEICFGDKYGLPVQLLNRPEGDGGIDFIVPLLFTIDVKTTPANNPGHMLVNAEKPVTADIYVAGRYKGPKDVEFIGWEWRDAVVRVPPTNWGGVMNHALPMITREQGGPLRPMSELERRMAVLRPFAVNN